MTMRDTPALIRHLWRPAPDSLWREMQRSNSNPRLHLFNYLWSLWIFATLFFVPGDEPMRAFWWSVGLSYPVFTALFALVHVRPFGEINIYASLMAMLAFVSMLWNPAAWTYAVFACVYVGIGTVQQPRHAILKIVMIVSVLAVLAWWLNWPWFVIVMALCICISSGLGALFGYLSQLRNRELRHTHDEVRRLAAATERERIGRDLHDLLGHTLSLITLKLELARRLFERDPERSRRELEEAEREARRALSEVRAAVTGIRTTDLIAELTSAQVMLASSGVALEAPAAPPHLPPEIERTFAMLLREAVTNIVRHAGATLVGIEMETAGGNARLLVHDNGRGGVAFAGNGLSGMRERVRAQDGVFRLDSPRGHGTTIEILLPLGHEPRYAALFPASQTGAPIAGAAP